MYPGCMVMCYCRDAFVHCGEHDRKFLFHREAFEKRMDLNQMKFMLYNKFVGFCCSQLYVTVILLIITN